MSREANGILEDGRVYLGQVVTVPAGYWLLRPKSPPWWFPALNAAPIHVEKIYLN